jgi:hypothetical protein
MVELRKGFLDDVFSHESVHRPRDRSHGTREFSPKESLKL